MHKKGKRNQEERALEEAPAFKRLNNQHSAVESNRAATVSTSWNTVG